MIIMVVMMGRNNDEVDGDNNGDGYDDDDGKE